MRRCASNAAVPKETAVPIAITAAAPLPPALWSVPAAAQLPPAPPVLRAKASWSQGLWASSSALSVSIISFWDNGKAVGQLLLTLLSCGLLSPISAIWGLIEGILILTGSISKDANGDPLAD